MTKVNRTEIKVICERCGSEFTRPKAHVDYHHGRKGLRLFCGKKCFYEARKLHKSAGRKKEEKRLYDMEYRKNNVEMLRKKKHDYYQRIHDPIKEAEIRKKRMHLHVQYCKQPWYKEWKKQYDQKFRAKKFYGEFWESAIIVNGLEIELKKKASWYDRQMSKGTLNKSKQRRKEYERESIYR